MAVKASKAQIDHWNRDMAKEIAVYEQDLQAPGQIVFYGPSNFTRWGKTFGMIPLRDVLLGASGAPCVVNRGFGSSCPEHQLQYYPRIIRPLAPKVLVYASYGNFGVYGYSIEEGWELAQQVIDLARNDFPDMRLYLCGGSPHRDYTQEALDECEQYEAYLRQYAAEHDNVFFLDCMRFAPLQDPAVFIEDGVHFNQTGYNLYGDYFREVLKEELEQY